MDKRNIKIIASILAIVLVVVAFVAVFVKLDKLETTETIGVGIFENGDIYMDGDKAGMEKKSDTALRTEDYITADGLTVELDEEAEIVYSIVFYDKDKTFISAVTDQAVDFDGTIPENAEFAKVVIHHATDAEYEFNLFNRRGFAKQLTITVNKD